VPTVAKLPVFLSYVSKPYGWLGIQVSIIISGFVNFQSLRDFSVTPFQGTA
jgi:hypothetical protein